MDLDKLTQPGFEVWVPFDEDTEVLIAYVPRDELQKMSKQATRTAFFRHQPTQELNPKEADTLLGRRAVKDWRALPGRTGFTMSGDPFLYSPENCDLLMTKWHAFSRFVNETCIDLDLLMEKEREATRKN